MSRHSEARRDPGHGGTYDWRTLMMLGEDVSDVWTLPVDRSHDADEEAVFLVPEHDQEPDDPADGRAEQEEKSTPVGVGDDDRW